jgi:hypothetical protein
MISSDTELEDVAESIGLKLNAIVSKDELNNMTPKQGAWIINMQDNTDSTGKSLGGTHWTGIWIEGKYAVAFDPFGLPPSANIEVFLSTGYNDIYPDQDIQDINTGWCGYYTLFFLWYMNAHKHTPVKLKLSKFLNLWSDDTSQNLGRLKNYIRRWNK